jgi:hypothetical protein
MKSRPAAALALVLAAALTFAPGAALTFAAGRSTQVGGEPNEDNPLCSAYFELFLSCWFTNYDRANTGRSYKPAPLGWVIADVVALPVTMPVGICLSVVHSGAGAAQGQGQQF